MKVFLDTNVLASAAATRGLCADILREVFASHDLFISDQVLAELRRVFKLKFRMTQDLLDDFMWLLAQDSIVVQPAKLPRIELKDRDDLAILGAAISAGAEVLVTGDKELIELSRMGNLEVLSPRQFWEKLKAQRPRGSRGTDPRRSR